MANYDSSQVGVPYIRCNNIHVDYPDNGVPTIKVEQALAVKLADGSITEIAQMQSISFTLDMIGHATSPIPIVNPTTGGNLGMNTNLQQVMLGILAVIRQQQLIQNP